MSAFNFVQSQPFTLAGAGVTIGNSSMTLTSFTQIEGALLTMADFGTIGFGTVDPGNGTSEEQISFSGVTQNANGTATLTGIKTVLFVSPYTQTANFARVHAGGAQFVISNTAGFYNELSALPDDETITGTWTFTNPNYPRINNAAPLPTDPQQFATKAYVDSVAIAGAPNADLVTKGIVQLATDAQLQAGTDIGTTGASVAAHGSNFRQTATANKVPVAGLTNKIDNNYINGGVANGFATLDAGSLVVQNPTNATITPTPAKIPISSVGNRLADGWQNITLANATELTGGGVTVLHFHPEFFGTNGPNTTGIVNVTQDIAITFTVGFQPKFFEAVLTGDLDSDNANDWTSGVNANINRQAALVKGTVGAGIIWTMITSGAQVAHPNASPPLNPYINAGFGTGTCAAPGLGTLTVGGGLTSTFVFKNITSTATTITFTWTYTEGNQNSDLRTGVQYLRVWA